LNYPQTSIRQMTFKGNKELQFWPTYLTRRIAARMVAGFLW
jgi:hypothetical protein